MDSSTSAQPSSALGSLADQITHALRQEIVTGTIPQGAPLTEPVLARRFKASRAPVREALIALEREGLVEFSDTKRTHVREMSLEDMEEVLSMRIALEGLAARILAVKWDGTHALATEANLRKQEVAKSLGELSHLDIELHAFIVQSSGNRRLISAWQGIRWQFEMCLAYTHRLQEQLDFEPKRITVESHRQLLAAISSGRPDLAEKTMARHIRAASEWLSSPTPETPTSTGKKRRLGVVKKAVSLACALLACLQTLLGSTTGARAGADPFSTQVEPLLRTRCYECHSHEKQIKGGLVLDSKSGWEQGGESGPAVVPGKPESSLLLKAISHADKDLAMPPKEKLSDEEIALLTAWVQSGAHDPRPAAAVPTATSLEKARHHWAFRPLTDPEIPSGSTPSAIDAFLRAAMSSRDLRPAALADRATLLRRASYDLTGLPPTPEQFVSFLADPRSDEEAFARVIEQLLASPAYGEKWGRHWLDLAHYADTTGCSSDWPIDDMWRYRDWVVAAVNRDVPFDQFLTEQLAGDLLAADMQSQPGTLDLKAYQDRIIATGFLATSKRFGSDPGGYAHLTIGDTIDTVSKALLGLTIGCARCHDHKFDPVRASDYYALYGIFASSLYPYTGAEKNQNAALLTPLEPPGTAEQTLASWNRLLPTPAQDPRPRSVLSSFSEQWGFEDNETSESVADRAPLSPWVSQGGVAVRDGNSPFTHLLPKGIKFVEFQATTLRGEMARRVRWHHPQSGIRSVAMDLRLAPPWEQSHRFSLLWRRGDSVGSVAEVVLARIEGQTLSSTTIPSTLVELIKGPWLHLRLTVAPEGQSMLQVWDEQARLLGDLPVAGAAGAFLGEGDLILRFETAATNDLRQACLQVDNIVAATEALPVPGKAQPRTVSPAGSVQDAAAAKLEADNERERLYLASLPLKPDTAFAMWEGTPHDAAIQRRGEPDQPTALVPRRNLLIFGGQPVAHPRRESGRRDLARWLMEETNPLTLRVFVNRLWQWHFGRGIVASPNDFGHKGEAPTHPELLDYLVQRFKKSGLSMKAMHREIMLSHAYRQSSMPSAEGLKTDPDNRWVAHYSPRRLTAEEVRDATLFVSGRLDRQGPGYRHPFPPLHRRGWNQHSPFSLSYEGSYHAYDHQKRSLYLPVVRLVADPFLSTFDGADSNQSVAVRGETAVPLQALALLNARFVVESASSLAALANHGAGEGETLESLHRQIMGVAPSPPWAAKLRRHFTAMTQEEGLPKSEALAVIAQALLSSNAFLYIF